MIQRDLGFLFHLYPNFFLGHKNIHCLEFDETNTKSEPPHVEDEVCYSNNDQFLGRWLFVFFQKFDGLSGQGFSPETVGQWSRMNPVFQEILPDGGKVFIEQMYLQIRMDNPVQAWLQKISPKTECQSQGILDGREMPNRWNMRKNDQRTPTFCLKQE